MKTSSQTPDYCEPWIVDEYVITSSKYSTSEPILIGHYRGRTGVRQLLRAAECVNACQGMADPAAEIQAMREAIKEADTGLSAMIEWFSKMHRPGLAGELVRALESCESALSKLQPFIQ